MSFLRFICSGSWRLATTAVAAGLVSGACSVALIAIINTALSRGPLSARWLLGGFVMLMLAKIGSNALAQLALNHFSQRMLAELCRDLTRRVLATPLRRLEALGAPRILTGLMDDVAVIGWAIQNVPPLAINLAVLAGCSVYLVWLSWRLFVGVLGTVVLGMLSYRVLIARAYRYLQRARDAREALFRHFRALTDGAKELKLHAGRRRAFLVEEVEPAIETLHCANLAGTVHHLVAESWTQLLFYGLVGLLLFGLPVVEPLHLETLSGYILASFYMMSPVWALIGSWPIASRNKRSSMNPSCARPAS